ncbi:MAG TPA: hypothetical protein VHH11_06215 [Gammaproteobacteria bacterium]|jgi:hypothetical protein|nr:hypothetical protein [Gammaproteobacteria bacterium]
MRSPILVAVAVFAAGCATMPVVWTKPESTPELVSTDLASCHRLAHDEMWRMSWERNWPPPFYDPRFMPPFYHAPRPFWLDFPMSMEREQALVDFCMHSKGYRLERLPY